MVRAVPEWLPTLDNLQYLSSVKRLDGVVYRLIAARRRKLASRESDRNVALVASEDLLTQLLQVCLHSYGDHGFLVSCRDFLVSCLDFIG